MSPSTLTTFTALNAVNLRADAGAAPTEIKSDSFQALLDIGTDENAPEKNPRLVKNDNDDDRKEIIAAPVDVASPALPEPEKLQADDGDHDAHVRAYNENADRNRLADKEGSDKPAPVAVKDSDVKPGESEEVKETVTEKPADAVKTAAAPSDAKQTNDTLADRLRNHIAMLSDALKTLATFVGNPQLAGATVIKTETKIDTIVLHKTDVVLTSAANPTPGLDKVEGTESDYSPKLALSDILSQIARIQKMLNNADAASMPDVMPALRALVRDIQEFSQLIRQHPEMFAQWSDEKREVIHATRALIREYRLLAGAEENAPDPAIIKPTDVTKTDSVSHSLFKTVSAAPVVPAADPVLPTNIQPAAAAIASAIPAGAKSGADTQTNTGGNPNGNNNPLPTAIASVRETSATPVAQAANAMDFARLLQQAKMPVMEQVMVHIKSGLADGASKIELKLHPEALGRVEIKIDTDATGKTGVVVTTDNKGTLDLLQRDARGLERALTDAGLKTDSGSLSFNLRGGQQEQNQNQNASSSPLYQVPVSGEAELAATPLSRSYVVNLSHGLDITI